MAIAVIYIYLFIYKLWRPLGLPQLDLLMWKSTVLLRVRITLSL